MHFRSTLLALSALLVTLLAQNTAIPAPRTYNLRTSLKTTIDPGNIQKSRFDNLWLSVYDTGRGQCDAVFVPDRTNDTVLRGFLTSRLYNFTMGTPYNWSMSQAIDGGAGGTWQLSE